MPDIIQTLKYKKPKKGENKMKYEAPSAQVVNFEADFVVAQQGGGVYDFDNGGRGPKKSSRYVVSDNTIHWWHQKQ
jgi:hypothetical protein